MDQRHSDTAHTARRTVRWMAPLLVVGAVLLLLALFYIEENWRGARVWSRTKKELAAKGEILDWNHYLPTPPPDERNMMKVPGMENTFIKGRTGGLIIATIPPRPNVSSNYIAYGEIEFVGDARKGSVSLQSLRTNATARRELMRAFAGRGVDAPMGIYLSERNPGSQPKRVTIAGDAATGVKEFQPKETLLKPNPDRVQVLNSNVVSLSVMQDRWYGAEAYLAWSAGQSNLFAMLDEAARRPECWLPGDYSIPFASPIPNFIAVRNVAQLLGSRAQAFMLLNRPDEAFADLRRIDTLNRIVEAKPLTLVSAMIRVAVNGLQTAVVADGFAMGAWEERHWRGFIEAYSARELLPQVVESLRSGERAGVLHLVEQLSTQAGFSAAENLGIKSLAEGLGMMPRGWVDQNVAFYARAMQRQIELFDAKTPIDPQNAQQIGEEIAAGIESKSPFRLVAQMAIPNIRKAGQTALKNQTLINQIVIASALELYRKENGGYPETLAELSPKFLKRIPRDVLLGQGLRYQKRQKGEYALYSVGWNAVDDVGPLLRNPNTPMFEIFESKAASDDWIWKGVPEVSVR